MADTIKIRHGLARQSINSYAGHWAAMLQISLPILILDFHHFPRIFLCLDVAVALPRQLVGRAFETRSTAKQVRLV